MLTQISASSPYFYGYSSGILNNQCCFESKTLNHTVLTVGWGVEGGKSYWIMRNSWGDGWGEAGYIRITATNTGYGICGNQFENWALTMTNLTPAL